LNEALRGEPPQPWTWRPNAKDDLRAKARDLRKQGLDHEEIVAELGVSKSSVSLWVRDMPRPPGLSYEECRKRSAEGVRRYWAAQRPIREAESEAARAASAAQIGQLSDREFIIAGAIAHWCEGTKNKPYRRSDRVSFMNSDPGLIRFFLRFLEAAGVAQDQLIFRVFVHESADIGEAQRFWLEITQEQICAPGRGFEPRLGTPKDPVLPIRRPGTELTSQRIPGSAEPVPGWHGCSLSG
jgi:hypothetical protein